MACNKKLGRFLALLGLLLCCAALPAYAQGQTPPAGQAGMAQPAAAAETPQPAPAGLPAEPQLPAGAAQTPAPPCQPVAPQVIEGSFGYLSQVEGSEEYDFYYDDHWFLHPSYGHLTHPGLVRMSVRAALAGLDVGYATGDRPHNIRRLMADLGYQVQEQWLRYPEPGQNTIGYAIGRKELVAENGQVFTVLMVATRGAGYQVEWGGNLIVGSDQQLPYHYGFWLGAQQIEQGLQEYLAQNPPNGTLKVWLTGYSRGAAVANILAQRLDDGALPGLAPENLFAYCFEGPRCTTAPDAAAARYDNILNIVNPGDLGIKLGLTGWDFTRYGRLLELPSVADADYPALRERMQSHLQAILARQQATGWTVEDFAFADWLYVPFINDLSLYLQQRLGDMAGYVQRHQGRVANLAGEVLGNGDPQEGMGRLADWLSRKIEEVWAGESSRYQQTQLQLLQLAQTMVGSFWLSHQPVLTLAWVDAITEQEVLWSGGGRYRQVSVHFAAGAAEAYAPGAGAARYAPAHSSYPGRVTVYNAAGQAVACMQGGEWLTPAHGVELYANGAGSLVVVLPGDAAYTIALELSPQQGFISCAVQERQADSGQVLYEAAFPPAGTQQGAVATLVLPAVDGQAEPGQGYQMVLAPLAPQPEAAPNTAAEPAPQPEAAPNAAAEPALQPEAAPNMAAEPAPQPAA